MALTIILFGLSALCVAGGIKCAHNLRHGDYKNTDTGFYQAMVGVLLTTGFCFIVIALYIEGLLQ